MGWYITCKKCGQEAKYRHPSCGHKEEEQDMIKQKMGQSMILEVRTDHSPLPGVAFHCKQGDEEFWVEYVAPGDYIDDGLVLYTAEEWRKNHDSVEDPYEDTDL